MSDAYRIRDPETWAKAKADYLSGLPAEAVCERYDLGLRAFWKHAKEGGWRRCDQPDPEPENDAEDLEPARPFAESVSEALARADRALRRGRAAEAQRFLALASAYESLAARAEANERRADKADADASFRNLQALERIARTGLHETKAELAVQTARARGVELPPEANKVHEVHETHGLDEQIAELERRILKRQALGAPANDLRKQLRKLRGPPGG